MFAWGVWENQQRTQQHTLLQTEKQPTQQCRKASTAIRSNLRGQMSQLCDTEMWSCSAVDLNGEGQFMP